jgi:hypothetical protein
MRFPVPAENLCRHGESRPPTCVPAITRRVVEGLPSISLPFRAADPVASRAGSADLPSSLSTARTPA